MLRRPGYSFRPALYYRQGRLSDRLLLHPVLQMPGSYTYGIGSFNVSLPQRSYWSITTEVNNEYTEATIEEIFKEIHKLRTETVPAEELNLVKNYLYGDLLRELDGVFAQSDSLKHKLNYGLDNSFYIGIIEKIRQCTPEAILELADKYWNPEEMYIVTAGQP